MREFIRTTLLGGLLFLIPLVVVMVVGKAFEILKTVATPLANFIPIDSVGDFAIVQVLTTAIMLAACLLAGLIARSA